MILNAYSIRDIKAAIYHNPFYKSTDGEAIRDFTSACSDEKTNLGKYPEDFSLYNVGAYDDNTGEFILTDKKHLIDAANLKKGKK